jgi:hypothetical protein
MNAVTADGSNHISGLSYDASGNTLTDGNYTYTWNGESQIKTAGGVTYGYDGDGRRAAKVGSKLYWYGSGGEVLSETDAAGNIQNEYVFFGGKRVALVASNGQAGPPFESPNLGCPTLCGFQRVGYHGRPQRMVIRHIQPLSC